MGKMRKITLRLRRVRGLVVVVLVVVVVAGHGGRRGRYIAVKPL